MPELPDILAYLAALEPRVVGKRLASVRLGSPFLLRSIAPPLTEADGRAVVGLARIGKRIVLALEGERFLVLHLMVAGRLHWKKKPGKVGGRGAVAAFDFADGSLVLSEASTKKRASLHFVAGRAALADFDRGGIEVLDASLDSVPRGADAREPHAEARADRPAALLGHRQRLLRRDPAPREALARQAHAAAVGGGDRPAPRGDAGRSVGVDRAARSRGGGGLSGEGDRVPGGDGRPRPYGKPCPVCGTKVQRIVYAENEANYCPTCQTGGKLLADRALSQLLRGDWPKTLEELEERKRDATPRGP